MAALFASAPAPGPRRDEDTLMWWAERAAR